MSVLLGCLVPPPSFFLSIFFGDHVNCKACFWLCMQGSFLKDSGIMWGAGDCTRVCGIPDRHSTHSTVPLARPPAFPSHVSKCPGVWNPCSFIAHRLKGTISMWALRHVSSVSPNQCQLGRNLQWLKYWNKFVFMKAILPVPVLSTHSVYIMWRTGKLHLSPPLTLPFWSLSSVKNQIK